MPTRLSKTLEAILARTARQAAHDGWRHRLPDRLALELLRDDGSLAYQLLTSQVQEWEVQQMCRRIEELLLRPADGGGDDPQRFFAELEGTLRECFAGVRTVSTGHALLHIASDAANLTTQVLEMYRIEFTTLHTALRNFHTPEGLLRAEFPEGERREGPDSPDGSPLPALLRASDESLLARFGTELTREAAAGKLDPVAGREREIERVVEVLSRRRKSNPILVGEAGVGKSAVVEGLAARIAAGEVPDTLAGRRIWSLDLAALVAGTKFRGEFEERLERLVGEASAQPDLLLFIDEIHTLVGAGSAQGSLDAANILKPALARGELRLIGATTPDEYRRAVESDEALARRFGRIDIEPASRAETLSILRTVAPHYERYHKVRYTDAALRACIDLSERYIADRHLPDKAVDLLDETGARVHLRAAKMPDRLRELGAELAEVSARRRTAVREKSYDRAATARLRELALREELQKQREAWRQELADRPAEADAADVERTTARITGIPLERASDDADRRLRLLPEYLARRVVGQERAVGQVVRALRRFRAGLRDANRPVGTFLFAGPTGTGKTLLAKELSKWLFDERRGLIRLDMGEYAEKHSVARLIGAPPGYVGYGEGGQLTEAVRRRPYSVVLFDEIEKAHPDLRSALLQLLDEGRLTDGAGRTVDFRNTIVILTSNVASREAAEVRRPAGYATASYEASAGAASDEACRRALERSFSPEFLNRLDAVVFFRPLAEEDLERILTLELDELLRRTRSLGYRVEVSPGARRRLTRLGGEARYGARALKRALLRTVEDPLSEMIVRGELSEGARIRIVSHGEGVRLRVV